MGCKLQFNRAIEEGEEGKDRGWETGDSNYPIVAEGIPKRKSVEYSHFNQFLIIHW